LAERVRAQIEELDMEFESNKISVTVSLGVACSHDKNFENPEQLIKNADTCLYYSKENGRNKVTALSTLP